MNSSVPPDISALRRFAETGQADEFVDFWEAAWSSPFAYSGMPLATRLNSLERWKTS